MNGGRVLTVGADAAAVAAAIERGADGVTADAATAADEAVDRLAAGGYDALVAGDGLPDRPPTDFVAAVRAAHPDLPVVVLAGEDPAVTPAGALEAGADDYLRRDADTDGHAVLAARVEAVVSWRRVERERSFFEQLVERTGVGVAAYGSDGRYEYVNRAFAALLDRDREAVVGEPIWAFNPAFEADRFEDYWTSLSPGETTTEDAFLERADGSRVPVETVTTCAELDGTRYHFGTVVDVSERAAVEAELARETNMFESLLEQVPIGIYFKNEAAEIVRASDHLLDSLEDTWGETPDGEPFTRETVLGRTDEELLPPEVGAKTAAADRRVIDEEETLTVEEHHQSADGESVWVRTSKTPWRDGDGEVTGLIGVSIDISERKRSEIELQRQNDRLERFASVVSHDLRNPLNVAQGHLELARDGADDRLAAVADAHDRMETLIEDLLELARQGDAVAGTEPVEVAEIVADCWRTVATADATLTVETDRTVEADRSRLQQLLENLLRNAVEHGGEGVNITVGDLKGGFYVADDGPGIPEPERDRVLESGYSTADGGTGFGLAIAAEIAAAHGWKLTVGESVDGGARFEITGVSVE